MPEPPAPDPLEARPVRPIKAHVAVLALAAVAPMTRALVERLTVYWPSFSHKLLLDLQTWGWLRPNGAELVTTGAGRRALREMIAAARQEVAARRLAGERRGRAGWS